MRVRSILLSASLAASLCGGLGAQTIHFEYISMSATQEAESDWGWSTGTTGTTARLTAKLGIDKDAFGTQESTKLNASYRALVSVSVLPGQEWNLDVNSSINGSFIHCNDGGDSAESSLSSIQGSLPAGAPYEVVSGSLTIAGDQSAGGLGKTAILGSTDAVIHGTGSQLVEIRYDWEANCTSIVSGLSGGDEAIMRLGQHITTSGIKFKCYGDQYASDVLTGEGHFVTVALQTCPTITTQPTSYSGCTPGALSVSVAGQPPFVYQWYRNGQLFAIAPETSSTTSTLVVTDPGSYFCSVQSLDLGCGVNTDTVSVTLDSAPTIDVPPAASYTTCPGSDLVLSATASAAGSGPLTYAWTHGTKSLFGPTVTLAGVSAADDGAWKLTVSNACGAAVANFAVVVPTPPSVSITQSTTCPDLPLALSTTVTPAGSYTYAWSKGGVALSATGPVLDLGAFGPEDDGTYSVVVTPAVGCPGSASSGPVIYPFGGAIDATWLGEIDSYFLTPPAGLLANWGAPLFGAASCPPNGCATVTDGDPFDPADLRPDAEFQPGDQWTLECLTVSGDNAVPQAVVFPTLSEVEVTSESRAFADGVLRLLGGELVSDVFVEPQGLLEGTGRVTGDVTIASFGRLVSPDLALVLAGPGDSLVLDGDLSSSGNVELQASSNARVSVLDTVVNGAGGNLNLGKSSLLQAKTLSNSGNAKLGQGSTLEITGPVGMTNQGVIDLACADITLAAGGTLTNALGALITSAGGANVTADTIVNSGSIVALGGKMQIVSNSLQNSGLVSPWGGGSIFLTGSYTTLAGSTIVVECGETGEPACPAPCVPAPLAGMPAPAQISAFGGMAFDVASELRFADGLLESGGDFRSAIGDPFAFDLAEATVQMDGFFSFGTQVLEIAAPDLGSPSSFAAPAYFGIGTVEIGPTPADVTLQRPAGATSHALYVERLVVDSQAVAHLGDVTLYAKEVEIQSGGHLALEQGTLFVETLIPSNACALGLVSGSCATQLLPLPAPDCDGNGIDDATDIAFGAPDCNANGIPDACDVALGLSLDQDADGVPDDCQAFHADKPWISIQGGGEQALALHPGAAFGGRFYFVGGSASGTQPGTPFGSLTVPLNFDAYSLMTLTSAGAGPFVATAGFLDAAGLADAAIELAPASVPVSGVGLVLSHAFVLFDGAGQVDFASNPTTLELRP